MALDPSAIDTKLLLVLAPQESLLAANRKRRYPADVRPIAGLAHRYKEVSVPFFSNVEECMRHGWFVLNRVKCVGGLDDVQRALDMSKAGVSAVKLIIRP